ncbi:hypothetical protein MTO96_034880 [Rhipicephalus appendiculatus]
MDLDWMLVRGRKRRVRSRESSKERLAAASSGGPGDLDLPELKRAAAAESGDESTSSTVQDSTGGWHQERACRISSTVVHRIISRKRSFESLAEQLKKTKQFYFPATEYAFTSLADAEKASFVCRLCEALKAAVQRMEASIEGLQGGAEGGTGAEV